MVDEMLRDRLRALPGAEGRFLRALGLETQRAAKTFAPVDLGKLQAGIKIQSGITPSGPFVKIEATAKHSIYVEKGTKPHTPPFSPIQRWALRHGIPAGALWMTIREKGTKAKPFMEPARDFAEVHAEDFADRELKKWGA